MVGVFFAWFAMSYGAPLWLAIMIAVIAGALIGFLTERMMVTPLMKRGDSAFGPILGTMAVGMIAEGQSVITRVFSGCRSTTFWALNHGKWDDPY